MKRSIFMKAVSAAISLQMICAALPQLSFTASAEADYYLDEEFSALDKWAKTDYAQIMDDEEISYLRYASDAETAVPAERSLDKSISSSTEIYVAEADVRFGDDNSGVVEFWGGSNLGPTIIFDGTNIKTKTGNPSTYVTMYQNAEAGRWYNVKLLANGRSSVYGYTADAESDEPPQVTRSDIKRNLRNAQLTKISVTNHVNSENTITRSGAVDVRNLKVYKALPDSIEAGADAQEVSVPQTDTASTVQFSVTSAFIGGIDLSSYDLLKQEILSFKLYDENNENEVSPEGVTINSKTGVLSVTSAASGRSEGTYTVRLSNYDDSAYGSVPIKVVPMGEAAGLEIVDAPSRIAVPGAGETQTAFGVRVTDQYGSEMSGIALNWSVRYEDGTPITDDSITIDEKGILTAKAGVHIGKVIVRAESKTDQNVYAETNAIEVYNMTADRIIISGDDHFALPKSGTASKTYSARLFDQNGTEMPSDTEKTWSVSGGNGVSIDNAGVLTVAAGTADTEATITVTAGEASASTKVTVYNQKLSKIEISGDRSIEIPKSGTKDFAYSAKALDQYGYEIDGAELSWSMSAYDNAGLSLGGSVVTATADAREQTVTLEAQSSGITGELRVVVTENPFRYKPIDGGFEIDTTSASSAKNYTRPIYAPHINDKGETSNRYLYYLGDRPKLVLSNASTSDFRRFMHMFLGIKGGKWLDEMQNVTARYVDGHEEYDITDPSFAGTIRLAYTRSDRIDGMMIKIELPDALKDKLVAAVAGQGAVKASQPTGGNSSNMEFNYQQTVDNKVTADANSFRITNNGRIDFADGSTNIDGTASIAMNFAVKDASAYSGGVDALLASTDTTYPMVVGTTEGNKENTIYILTAPRSSMNEPIESFGANAAEYFEDGISYYKRVSETIKIDTPDPYINSGVKAQVMAMDNIWDDPVITHGAIGWHNGQGGWRGGYCFVDALWGDRLKTNIAHYVKHQESDGRIWAYPSQDGRYNMSLVMVDILMQYWDWSGDKSFFTDTIEGKNEAVYNLVKGHLEFMDKEMQVPGTNLYENWLDAWNTDNKWNNGGAGSIATSYTWRAYNTMAQIAAQIGKSDDAAKYQAKADAIKKEMNEQLWDTDTGVFGEVRERFGHGRLNAAPDLSSVYTVVDMGVATQEQVYQMMRFTDYAVPSIANQRDIWHDIDFKYSSNRPPEHYSSDGLYIEEVMNNALAYFENGQRGMGMKQFRACLVPLMKGSAAGQGTAQHIVKASLENNGHIDFGDATSQYARTALEGIFGVKMHVPEGRVDITPGFPEDWKYASVETSYLAYDYKYENNTDRFVVSTNGLGALSYAMHIPARSSKIESVAVNGAAAEYTVDGFVNVTTPAGESAVIEVKYADDEIAAVNAAEIGGTDAEYTVKSNGTITAVSDPQGITTAVSGTGSDTISVTLGEKTGDHTFFVTVEKNDMKAVLPVDLKIKGGIEITDTEITNEGISVKLTNNTEKQVSVRAELSTVSGSITRDVTIEAKGKSDAILVPVKNAEDLTPGNNKVTAVLTGDINRTVTGEAIDWSLKNKITNSDSRFKTISLNAAANQDLRTLHQNKYDMTYDGNEHYRLPDFYWVVKTKTGTPRTVLENGRSWWETSSPSHAGANSVPAKLSLPENGGRYVTDAGVPFEIASNNGNNAAFVSLYNQFPDKLNIPVNTDGSKLYFMLSVSTNNMQSRIENARITVNMKDGTSEVLPLTNPDNIDDWLNYQTSNPYAESGFVQMLDSKAHSNIVALDFGEVKQIESIDFECMACEVLAGLLGVTVVGGEYSGPETTTEPAQPTQAPEATQQPTAAPTQAPSEEPNGKYMHISFDDVCLCLKDISTKDYSSVFENSFLASLKSLHDDYGAVFTLNCFNTYSKDSSYSITNLPDRYAQELADSSDWLKFAFHAEDDLTQYTASEVSGRTNGTAEQIKASYKTFTDAIMKAAGNNTESIDTVTRLGFFAGDADVIDAVKECELGITGLLTADDTRVSYYFDDALNSRIISNNEFYDKDKRLRLIRSQVRLESVKNTSSTLEGLTNYDRNVLEVFTHEQEYKGNVVSRLRAYVEWAYENGYGFDYAMNVPGDYMRVVSGQRDGASINYSIEADTNDGAEVIAAVYDDGGRLISVSSAKTASYEAQLSTDAPEGTTVRLMLWDSFAGMEPLGRQR